VCTGSTTHHQEASWVVSKLRIDLTVGQSYLCSGPCRWRGMWSIQWTMRKTHTRVSWRRMQLRVLEGWKPRYLRSQLSSSWWSPVIMCAVTNLCVTWLILMCDMTDLYVWHDAFICVTWRIHMCDMTHPYVWHGPSICVTWPIHMCDMTHSWVIHMCVIAFHTCAYRRVCSIWICYENIPEEGRVFEFPRQCAMLADCTIIICDSYVPQRIPFFDGYCSTVQGFLDWFEVDLGFTFFFLMGTVALYRVCSTDLR